MWIEQGTESAYLVNESTKAVIQSKPSTIGKPVMTSMLIVSHGRVLVGKGKIEPSG
jgi:hypothetical protein